MSCCPIVMLVVWSGTKEGTSRVADKARANDGDGYPYLLHVARL